MIYIDYYSSQQFHFMGEDTEAWKFQLFNKGNTTYKWWGQIPSLAKSDYRTHPCT